MTTSHGKLKIYHFFFPMGIPVKKMRDPNEDKFKSGNLMEARDYYREAIIYVEDLVDARRKERNDLLIPLYSNLAQAACGAFFGKKKMLRKMWEHSGILCVFPTSRKVWPFTWEDGVELIAHFHHSDDFIRFQAPCIRWRRYFKVFIADACSTVQHFLSQSQLFSQVYLRLEEASLAEEVCPLV